MSEGAPRSAFEIAMERLRQKDAEAGIEAKPRTEAQRAEIAEVRSLYQAKLAQTEVMHASRLAALTEPAARDVLDEEYRRERQRLTDEMDAKIDRVRAR